MSYFFEFCITALWSSLPFSLPTRKVHNSYIPNVKQFGVILFLATKRLYIYFLRHIPLLTFLLVFQVRYEYYNNCNYTEVGEPFAEHPYAVAVQQGSHLQEEISKVILELQKDRYFETLSSKYWNSTLRSLCPTLDDSEGEYYFTCSLQVLYVLIHVNLFLPPSSLHRSHLNKIGTTHPIEM